MKATMGNSPLSQAELLRQAVVLAPTASIATWTGAGLRYNTFSDLGRDTARLANLLTAFGVERGDRVGTFMWNNYEHLVAYHAIPAMGAVIHPINIRLYADQVGYVATHAQDRVILVDGSLIEVLADCLAQMDTVEHVIVVNAESADMPTTEAVRFHRFEELMKTQAGEFEYPVLDENAPSTVCYTSGTTGNPKAVVYSHRSNWLHAMYLCSANGLAISAQDQVLPIVPMFHANGWGLPHACLMAGSSIVMPDRFLKSADLLQIMSVAEPTFAAAVPTIWTGVLRELENKDQDIRHLREIMVGGAALPKELMEAFSRRHDVQLVHAWGMTETSPLVTVARPPAGTTGSDDTRYRLSQGKIPVGVQARIVDDRGHSVAWDGASVGELQVRGPWITSSYYGLDVDSGFDNGWLRTGDVGHLSPDGYLTLVDRSKDLIKSGGEWISSIQLENEVMGHPDVHEAAVVGIKHDKWGERPLVVVVREPRSDIGANELRSHLGATLAKWQIPESWVFVEEIPKTSVGKFDKKRIRTMYEDGVLSS
ncbi:long-chain fatty acid--CoA ligase [Nocardia nova]|uniref:long-chain fatty acid--CoA ligase n=1 Tax=Nocardia nova TaxID=37330 RepID=UPI001C4501CB|nr:long-chain fatty acid--CoA ligase [Nocardia nova]MBV7708164.1 long-chain fatty acid--CoA ligase [Nocardia nova]